MNARIPEAPRHSCPPADPWPSMHVSLSLCSIAVLAGAVIRLIPCFDDFWLDEIWSYFLARNLSSPWGVFTSIHHSNNNHLYTLLLYMMGDRTNWAIYRIPSLLAGIASIGLAARIAWRRGRLEAIYATFLTSFSFALIHFSSEARGYALAAFFALCAYDALERDLKTERPITTFSFGISVILGYLSHLTFLFFYAGAIVWSYLRLIRQNGIGWLAVRRFMKLHVLPVSCFLLLYWIDLRRMQVGSGNHTPLDQLLAMIFGYTLGFPVVRVLAIPYTLLAAALLGLGLRQIRKEQDGVWVLYLTSIVVAPVLVLSITRPVVVAVRYFLVCVPFYLLLLAFLLSRLYRTGRVGRLASITFLTLFLLGNAWHTAGFLRYGRGGYLKAFRYMALHTAGSRIVVGSDHDFRNGLVARFYAKYLPPEKKLVYCSLGNWPRQGPEWVIVHRTERPKIPRPWMRDGAGNRYALVAAYNYAAISGFYWAIYHNIAIGDHIPPLS